MITNLHILKVEKSFWCKYVTIEDIQDAVNELSLKVKKYIENTGANKIIRLKNSELIKDNDPYHLNFIEKDGLVFAIITGNVFGSFDQKSYVQVLWYAKLQKDGDEIFIHKE